MTVSMDKKYVTRNGLYTAKVVYIHDKGEHPVVVFAEHKDDGLTFTFRTNLNGREFSRFDDLDLIEVPEEKPALTLRDYHAAFDKGWDSKRVWSKPLARHCQSRELYRAGIKAVLELAGVKVL